MLLSLFYFYPGGLLVQLRVAFYLRSIALQDVETQRHGIINLICVEDINNFNQDFFKKVTLSEVQANVKGTIQLTEGLPGRTVVEHVCYDQMNTLGVYLFSTILKFIIMAFTPFMKVRMQIHTGKERKSFVVFWEIHLFSHLFSLVFLLSLTPALYPSLRLSLQHLLVTIAVPNYRHMVSQYISVQSHQRTMMLTLA